MQMSTAEIIEMGSTILNKVPEIFIETRIRWDNKYGLPNAGADARRMWIR